MYGETTFLLQNEGSSVLASPIPNITLYERQSKSSVSTEKGGTYLASRARSPVLLSLLSLPLFQSQRSGTRRRLPPGRREDWRRAFVENCWANVRRTGTRHRRKRSSDLVLHSGGECLCGAVEMRLLLNVTRRQETRDGVEWRPRVCLHPVVRSTVDMQ